MIYGMVIEMGGNGIHSHIVSRLLYRCEAVYLFSIRHNYDSTRMLSCGSLNIYAALGKSFNLCMTLGNSSVFAILKHITICSLFRNGTNCSGSEGIILTEDFADISMGSRLIFSGEVQIYIRLLITLESQECFKWYIMSFLFQRCAALRADCIRHVTT